MAVAEHRAYAAAWYAGLVGPLVVGDQHLAELSRQPGADDPAEPLPLSVVVSGGAGALEGAVRWAARSGALELRSLEIALRDDATGAIEHNARRILTAVDQLVSIGDLEDEIPVYVEPPRLYGAPPTPGWLGALDEIAAAGHRLKFRTGGPDADAFPAAHELAACLEAALDREAPFKCTAGLHHAVRHRAEDTGFEHHGFLNVLLATRATFDSAPVDDVAALLETTDPDAVVGALREHGDDALAAHPALVHLLRLVQRARAPGRPRGAGTAARAPPRPRPPPPRSLDDRPRHQLGRGRCRLPLRRRQPALRRLLRGRRARPGRGTDRRARARPGPGGGRRDARGRPRLRGRLAEPAARAGPTDLVGSCAAGSPRCSPTRPSATWSSHTSYRSAR